MPPPKSQKKRQRRNLTRRGHRTQQRIGTTTSGQTKWCKEGAWARSRMAECTRYQTLRAPNLPDPNPGGLSKLDWKRLSGSAPGAAFDEVRFSPWRFFWDFGGGIFTDLMTHWTSTWCSGT